MFRMAKRCVLAKKTKKVPPSPATPTRNAAASSLAGGPRGCGRAETQVAQLTALAGRLARRQW